MNDASLQRALIDLFAAHDVDLEPDEDGWLLTDDDLPAIRATWHAGQGDAPGRLDIDVVFAEERHLEESFAGHGPGDAAVREALDAFAAGALPVLLAAFWYVTDDRTLDLGTLQIGLHDWDLFHGRWQVRGVGPEVVPAGARAAIEQALREAMPAAGAHALRLFHADGADGARTEVLLDNEPWAAGTRALAACDWPAGSYAAHALVVLDVRDY